MPGERTPRNVPMMPLTDIGALSTGDSNHSSRKSTALIENSLRRSSSSSAGASEKCRPRRSSSTSLAGCNEPGSGAGESITGLAKRPMCDMASPNSPNASASFELKRETSLRVSSGSDQRHSESPSGSGRNEASSGIISSPKRASSSSRMIHGRSRLTTYEHTE